MWFDPGRSLVPQIALLHGNPCDDGCSLAMPVTADLHFMPLLISSGRSVIGTFARRRRSDPRYSTGLKNSEA
jgi:hypothetical protein